MKKVISSILAAVLITGTLTACSGSSSSSNANEKSSDNNGLYQKTELKMDTTIDLRAIGPKAKTAVDEAMKRLDEIDQEAVQIMKRVMCGKSIMLLVKIM
jgi:outer membrane murein-binding lipoprotein Lpp